MHLLSLKEALTIYQSYFDHRSKFGMNIALEHFLLDHVVVLDKNIHLKNVTGPIKFDFYTLLLSLDGELMRHINQNDYKITPYTFQLLPPDTIYSFENISQTSRTYMIAFDRSYIAQAYEPAYVQNLLHFHHANLSPILLPTPLFTRVINMFEDISHALKEINEDSHCMVKVLILRLLLLLKHEKIDQNKLDRVHKTRPWQLTYRYLDLVEKHFCESQKVCYYAKMLDITAKHLSETIKETLGESALFYIQQRLLKEALYLLRYTDLPITHIASKLSFQTPSEFSRFFKKHHKMSPKAFRLHTPNL